MNHREIEKKQQKWIKKGLIFRPSGQADWMATHASVPIAVNLGDDLFRIYFSGRDALNRSQTGFIEININKPLEILYITKQPIIELGKLGAFDESGAMSCWIMDHEGKKHLYYIGWNLGVNVPFRNSIGLAISNDGGRTFTKFSDGPILDRDIYSPCFVASPCVLLDGETWRMWYLSCIRWKIEDNKPKHYYHIKYAESSDGIQWKKSARVCIDFKSSDEYAISRPCVLKDGDIYKMWYSYKGDSYRIGYAESKDGLYWERKDELVGIDVSKSGWDSEMIEYPFVFDHKGKRYMLYNGNGYGITGIGLAILAEK